MTDVKKIGLAKDFDESELMKVSTKSYLLPLKDWKW